MADKALPYGVVVDVMATVQRAGITGVGMITNPRAGAPGGRGEVEEVTAPARLRRRDRLWPIVLVSVAVHRWSWRPASLRPPASVDASPGAHRREAGTARRAPPRSCCRARSRATPGPRPAPRPPRSPLPSRPRRREPARPATRWPPPPPRPSPAGGQPGGKGSDVLSGDGKVRDASWREGGAIRLATRSATPARRRATSTWPVVRRPAPRYRVPSTIGEKERLYLQAIVLFIEPDGRVSATTS